MASVGGAGLGLVFGHARLLLSANPSKTHITKSGASKIYKQSVIGALCFRSVDENLGQIKSGKGFVGPFSQC